MSCEHDFVFILKSTTLGRFPFYYPLLEHLGPGVGVIVKINFSLKSLLSCFLRIPKKGFFDGFIYKAFGVTMILIHTSNFTITKGLLTYITFLSIYSKLKYIS